MMVVVSVQLDIPLVGHIKACMHTSVSRLERKVPEVSAEVPWSVRPDRIE